jgi:hypothetical protein
MKLTVLNNYEDVLYEFYNDGWHFIIPVYIWKDGSIGERSEVNISANWRFIL